MDERVRKSAEFNVEFGRRHADKFCVGVQNCGGVRQEQNIYSSVKLVNLYF